MSGFGNAALDFGPAWSVGLDSARFDPTAPPYTSSSEGVGPFGMLTKEELQAYRYAQKIIMQAVSYRKREGIDRSMRVIRDAFRGEHWPSGDDPGWRARVTLNYLYRVIEEASAMMTENNPRFNLKPPHNQQTKYVDMMRSVLNFIFRNNKMKRKAPDLAKSMNLYGVGYLKSLWNPRMSDGLGDVEIVLPNTMNIWRDRYHAYLENSNYVVFREAISVEDAISQFPSLAPRIRRMVSAFNSQSATSPRQCYNGLSGPSFASPQQWNVPDMDVPWTASDADIGDTGETIVKTEIWLRDPSTVKVDDYIYISKYAHETRLLQFIGPFPIYSGETPYEFEGFPIAEAKDISIPNEPYPSSTAMQIWAINKMANKGASNITDWMTYFSNPAWIGDAMALENWNILTTAPGLVIKKRRGYELRREAPPNMPSTFFATLDFAIRELNDIAGIRINTAKQASAKSAMAMETIHEVASYIVKAKVRQLECCYEDLAPKIIKLVQQYYTENRIIRIEGDAGKVDFVEFNGGWIKGDWSVEVEPSSTLPVSRAVLNAQAAQNFQMGAIDKVNYLETIQWPGYQDVLRRDAESAKAQHDYDMRIAELTGKNPSGGGGKRQGKMKGKRPGSYPV